ncbi:hypothetical protein [Deinococcus maricopensis]|uniref:7-cyano-7-deazaguanine reductase n=1 Tax=Deinococcus maricopensis (strain DSM 21211 / LMG 22137 / NRRL B-23946 / LB-34) TaxID=709986 RepID=E8U5U5_DEIML|nr:hypothetical protein [Deinococcus maricopensis]ADV66434.1 hypothetical protein Deima_0778 [Deinococcus maricopensis DSM 21211]
MTGAPAEPRAHLRTIGNARPHLRTTVEHVLHLPELCPASHNPAPGSTLTVRYAPRAHLLELFSLDAYVRAFHQHPVVRDIEFFVQTVAEDCAATLGLEVTVCGDVKLNMVRQEQRVTVTAGPPA